MLERFKRSLEEATVIKKGEYDYFVHPITDGVPRADPAVLEEVVGAMLDMGRFDCDLLLAPEALGIPLAVSLSSKLRMPYAIARKRSYGLAGEIRLDQSTGYSSGAMYINDVKAGDRVVVVDDVISTGGTLRSMIAGLKTAGVEVVDVLIAVEKGDAAARLQREAGVPVRALVSVEVQDGRVVVLR